MSSYLLSKSSFVKSVQCLKAFHLYKYHYAARDPVTKDKQAIFNRGTDVGIVAQKLFPGGVDVSPTSVRKYNEAVEKTKELVDLGQEIIYEATFVFNEVLVAIDMLIKKNNKWYAYEVKSSLKISPAYVLDASLQYYVIKNCVPDLEDIFLVTVNGDYVFESKLNVDALFKFCSVKKDASANWEFIEDRINKAKAVIENPKSPDIGVGEHCFKPYKCDFFGTCWKNIPEKSVFLLSNVNIGKQVELYQSGVKTIDSIEFFDDLPAHTQKQVKSLQANKEVVEVEKINSFLSSIHYPIGFFDIELYTPAIPVFTNTKPYQQIPFLFSLHVIHSDGEELKHDYFYAVPGNDPREAFIKACIDKLSHLNSIVVFDSNLELGVFNSLMRSFPNYASDIEKIKNKIKDIAPVFTQMNYFHPNTIGSSTLKNLFLKLFNDNSFETLALNSGTQATYAYNALQTEENEIIKSEVEQSLIEYCKTDTFATAKLFMHLQEVVSKH